MATSIFQQQKLFITFVLRNVKCSQLTNAHQYAKHSADFQMSLLNTSHVVKHYALSVAVCCSNALPM